MAWVDATTGNETWAKAMVGVTSAGNLKWHLFTNTVTPTSTTPLASYTEATSSSVPGYAAITTTAGSGWTVTTVAGTTQATYANLTVTVTGATTQNISGYYVTDSGGTVLIAAEALGSPLSFGSGGGTVVISPEITLGTC